MLCTILFNARVDTFGVILEIVVTQPHSETLHGQWSRHVQAIYGSGRPGAGWCS